MSDPIVIASPSESERRRIDRRLNARVGDLTLPELRRILITTLMLLALVTPGWCDESYPWPGDADSWSKAVGTTLTLPVGGKIDPSHGAPVSVTGRVRTLSDGRFRYRGPMWRGAEGRVGLTAVLDVNDVKIVLISLRRQTVDPEMIRFVGIDPTVEKILVVKSSIHYRAAFEPIARAILEVDAPGLSSSLLGRVTFTRVRRPLFPLPAL